MAHYDGMEEAHLRAEVDRLKVEVERLKKAVKKMSHRKCWDCGHTAYYLDAVAPHCLCEKCNSQDTRLIREAAEATEAAEHKTEGNNETT